MAKEWQVFSETHDLVLALVEKFPKYFSRINAHDISCIIATGGKAPNRGRTLAKIRVINAKTRVATGTPYKFILEVYDANWYDLDDRQKAMVIFHELQHIDQEEEDPKLVKHNVEDFHGILATWGLNYINNNDLPDLLDSKLNEEDYGLK